MTAAASLAYCSYLIPALQDPYYELTAEGVWILTTRILFFFIAAVLVNRFAAEGVIGEMDCVYSSWATDAREGFDDSAVAAP